MPSCDELLRMHFYTAELQHIIFLVIYMYALHRRGMLSALTLLIVSNFSQSFETQICYIRHQSGRLNYLSLDMNFFIFQINHLNAQLIRIEIAGDNNHKKFDYWFHFASTDTNNMIIY